MGTCYRLSSTGNWQSRGEHIYHTRIWNVMEAEVPITTMCGDNMVPQFFFDHQFKTMIPTRDEWEDADAPVVPEGTITVYTDGSNEPRGTGAGNFFNGLSTDLSIPLGTRASVFQAETYAIMKCATVLQTLDLTNTCVYICSDSQAAITA